MGYCVNTHTYLGNYLFYLPTVIHNLAPLYVVDYRTD